MKSAAQTRFEDRIALSESDGEDQGTLGDAAKRLAKKDPKRFRAAVRLTTVPPAELAYVLQWYEELRGSNSRGWHFEPISYTEIHAYKSLHDLEMDSNDVSLLIVLDGLWMKAQPKPKTKGKP